MNKYNAKRCEEDGIKFDSLMERKYYQDLKLLLKAKEIDKIKCHPVFPISINNEKHICNVELDFQYFDNKLHKWVFVDVKGVYTQLSKIKHKLFEAQYGEKVTIIRKAKR